MVTDHVSGKGNAIECVRLSVRLLPPFLNELASNLDFCNCTGYDHSSPVIEPRFRAAHSCVPNAHAESQCHKSGSMQKCGCYTTIDCGVL